MKKNILHVAAYCFIAVSVVLPQKKNEIGKITRDTASYSKFNINQISTYIYNNGWADQNIIGNSSFVYPKRTNGTAIFQSGLVWGGKINGQIRIGGSTYYSGLKPGKILENGSFEEPSSERVFRVRRDYKTADLNMEATDEGKSEIEIYDQYARDWNEWPVSKGAPFEDVNGDGVYNPDDDIPGAPGADQTLWFVANDLDSNQTKSMYGSLPMGIEMQTTVWGYSGATPIGNIIFKKYWLINKSRKEIEDMYIGVWADPDLGDASDDYVGCDSTLDVGYVYNSKSKDVVYSPLPPPSVGFCLLRGPVVEGNTNDVARFKDRKIYGKKNLSMTAFSNVYKNGVGVWHEPSWGEYQGGTIFLYNLLKGLLGNGTPHPMPVSMGGGTTKFPYSGDPIKGTGFIGSNAVFSNSDQSHPGDKKLMVCSGPFNMAPGDTQEVIFAEVAGGAVDNSDYLSAITSMKSYTKFAKLVESGDAIPVVEYETPNVTATGLENEIILNWGNDATNIEHIEKGNSFYKFQGYNVYQFPVITSKLSDGKLIATYDIVDGIGKIFDLAYDSTSYMLLQRPIQFGSDSGIQRFISIKKDSLRGQFLNNGNDYCFGVTQYSYTDKAITPKSLESGFKMIRIKPQSPPAGTRYNNVYGDIITSSHQSGSSSGEVSAFVVDPTKLTGHSYQVTFQITDNVISFSLLDVTDNKSILTGQKNLNGDNDYVVTDGFILKVKDNSSRRITENDVFSFKTNAPTYNQKLAKEDVELINVFPNPYYGYNRMETNNIEKIVTFTHLPVKATVRIFNLAGQLVRKLEKNSSDTFLRWDLLNESQFQAPSGIYIIHFDLPEIGKTKILKLAIVQDGQF